MTQPPISVSSARLLVVIMFGVVISFLMATVFGQMQSMAIDHDVSEIAGNAIPSVQHLARARSALRRTLTDANRLEEASPADQAPIRDQTVSDKMDIEAALDSYQSYPFFPGEKTFADQIDGPKSQFMKDMDAVLRDSKSGAWSAMQSNLRSARFRAQLFDEALGRGLDYNAVQGQRLGLEISTIRRKSLFTVIFWDLMSVLLAVVATAFTIWIVKRSLRSTEERADELEMFSSRVAHDLKGPLSAMLLTLDLADRPVDDERRAELRKQIRQAAGSMNVMIDGLLDFARSGARPGSQSGDLSATVSSVIATLQQEANEKHISLFLENEKPQLAVACSSGQLASVINNLVRNALRYVTRGSSGPPRVIVRVRGYGNCARCEIEDNGPGIEQTKQKEIFQPYVRVLGGDGGLGLGLATVKRIIEAHGGEAGVISTFGAGSLFWFELPLAR